MQDNLRRRVTNLLLRYPRGVGAIRLARRIRAGGLRLGPESVPAGHYYSALPSVDDLRRVSQSEERRPAHLGGIALRTAEQLELVESWRSLREDDPFYSTRRRVRYDIENNSYSYDDAPVLAYMLRSLKPHRIVEIGSGASSACMLDVCDQYLEGTSVELTCIDIDASPLRAVLRPDDLSRVTIIERAVQDVDPALFDQLEENDLLFVDSSHVVKAGSDVCTILFDVLPRLRSGVVVHFHDVRFPFRYPENVSRAGLFWNEAYTLRAFLQYNDRFTILLWTNYLVSLDPERLGDLLPLGKWHERFGGTDDGYHDAGGSLYLRVGAPDASGS